MKVLLPQVLPIFKKFSTCVCVSANDVAMTNVNAVTQIKQCPNVSTCVRRCLMWTSSVPRYTLHLQAISFHPRCGVSWLLSLLDLSLRSFTEQF